MRNPLDAGVPAGGDAGRHPGHQRRSRARRPRSARRSIRLPRRWAPRSRAGTPPTAAAFFAALALLAGRRRSASAQAVLVGVAVGIAVAVASSRVLLDLHWVSDVIAGLALGWGWFAVCAIAFGGWMLRLGAPVEQAAAAAPASRPRRRCAPEPRRGPSTSTRVCSGWSACRILARLDAEDRHVGPADRPAPSPRSSCRTWARPVAPADAGGRTPASRASARRTAAATGVLVTLTMRRSRGAERISERRADELVHAAAAALQPPQRHLGHVGVVDVAADDRDRGRRRMPVAPRRRRPGAAAPSASNDAGRPASARGRARAGSARRPARPSPPQAPAHTASFHASR